MESKGHKVVVSKQRWGNMQTVFFNKVTGSYEIANDPRGLGQ